MTELALDRAVPGAAAARGSVRRAVAASTLAVLLVGNVAALVWLWYHGGNVTRIHGTGPALASAGRITGLLSAYLALVEVVLLSRLPQLERLVGFDRLTVWHRWNGHACVDLVVAHVVLTIWGYALIDKLSVGGELSTMLGGGVYPGMITATVGTALFIAIGASSVVVARRKLPYEWWYAVHFTAYAAIALSWFHEIPTGNELVLDQIAADYWRSLFAATLAVLLTFRLLVPLGMSFRHRLHVLEVIEESPSVVSIRIGGRRLDTLAAQAGQFFIWRFLDGRRWWKAHPFSLSAPPDGESLRITIKALGDDTSRMRSLRPGTRVLAEGPFGVFTDAARHRERVLLVAGGIGITPVRSLFETMGGDIVVVYRVVSDEDAVLRDELDEIARRRKATVHYVVGDHRGAGADLLSPTHVRELVPDLDERDVFLCGPPAMIAAVSRNLREAGVARRRLHIERFALT